jgi:hypothetical protein
MDHACPPVEVVGWLPVGSQVWKKCVEGAESGKHESNAVIDHEEHD